MCVPGHGASSYMARPAKGKAGRPVARSDNRPACCGRLGHSWTAKAPSIDMLPSESRDAQQFRSRRARPGVQARPSLKILPTNGRARARHAGKLLAFTHRFAPSCLLRWDHGVERLRAFSGTLLAPGTSFSSQRSLSMMLDAPFESIPRGPGWTLSVRFALGAAAINVAYPMLVVLGDSLETVGRSTSR